MARTLNSSVEAEIQKESFVNAHLVRFKLYDDQSKAEVFYHITDYFKGISYNGNYYDPVGSLLNVTGLSESNKFDVQKISITLSGINRLYISSLLQFKYTSRDIIVYKQFYRTTGVTTYKGAYEPIGVPVEIFNGRIDNPTITDDPNNDSTVVTVEATSVFSDFDRKAGRHTNDTEQKYHFPSDNFFKLWGKIDEDLIWGKQD